MEEQQALRPLLEVLVAAREPLTRAELRDVLYGVHPSLCPPDGSGQVEFERRMQLLDGFITAVLSPAPDLRARFARGARSAQAGGRACARR